MAIELVPITRSNLVFVAKAALKWGMPRSARWLERCLFDPTVENLVKDEIRGHLSVREDGEPVAIQCYYYMPGYIKQKRILINSGCIMGADAKYGEELLCCMDANKQHKEIGAASSSNCMANEKSAKISRVVNKTEEAPLETRQVRFAMPDVTGYIITALRHVRCLRPRLLNWVWVGTRPLAWLECRLRRLFRHKSEYAIVSYDKVDEVKFGEFWRRFLADNDGLVMSREPQRLAWLFNDSIAAGTVRLITAEKDGEIEGYAIIRKMPQLHDYLFFDFTVCDVCAIDKNENCLEALARAMVDVVRKAHGVKLRYNGALPGQDRWLNCVFRLSKDEGHPTFMYKVNDADVKESLQRNEGWFFGPFDGERCLGYGGYVDY